MLTGGVRLVDKPLHLGHYVGTFSAFSSHNNNSENILYYIIKDTEPYLWESTNKKKKIVEKIATQALCMAENDNVRILLQSQIVKYASFLNNIIYDSVTYKSNVTCHFEKSKIRENKYKGKMTNFIYPLEECLVMTFLNVSFFYSNTDNEVIVDFIRKVQAKINLTNTNRTKLINYPNLPNYPGSNYKRMCTKNQNIMPIICSDKQVEDFSHRICSLGQYFNYRKDLLQKWKEDKQTFIPEKDYLPFLTTKILSNTSMDHKYIDLKFKKKEFEDMVYKSILPKFKSWRDRFEELSNSEHVKFDYIYDQSNDLAQNIAAQWLKKYDLY